MTNWSGRFEASDLFVIVGIAAARASKALQRLTLEGDEQVGGFSPTW
jgi:hypothetical protein